MPSTRLKKYGEACARKYRTSLKRALPQLVIAYEGQLAFESSHGCPRIATGTDPKITQQGVAAFDISGSSLSRSCSRICRSAQARRHGGTAGSNARAKWI